ncbi:MAG: SLBB domain-containing protein [Candidatus Eisenbacteria bacterium]|nr:SLBB domain-containing protein [Candidatus Eisenbacteria bacterium]
MIRLSSVLAFRLFALTLLITVLGCSCALAAEPVEGQRPAEDQQPIENQQPANNQQETPKTDESRRSQYYLNLGTEDALQFYVHVWGQVGKPGLYLVADGTDLVGLLSLAGGPTEDANLTEIKLVRTGAGGKGAIAVDLKRYTGSGDWSRIPVLEPGDTVVVPATFWHKVMRFGSILSVTALLANVIVYATR